MPLVIVDQGLTWAFRLLLNRDRPTEHYLIEAAKSCRSASDLRHIFINSEDFKKIFINPGYYNNDNLTAEDKRNGVIWAYRLYFLQEPSEEQIRYHVPRVAGISDIRATFLLSLEFKISRGYGLPQLTDLEVLNRFAPYCREPAPEGSFHDFLGARTRLSYLPPFYASKSGTFEGPPRSPTAGMHSPLEWTGTLRSVLEASRRLTVVELGAGWAPWLVSSALAAKRRGITDLRLIGVEGSAEHVEFMRQHFVDNGLDPDAHRLLHAVAGATDGVARFPKLVDASQNYGANAVFKGSAVVQGEGLWEEIECFSVETLLLDLDRVDLMHIDIQGAEVDVVQPGMPTLNEKVRRVVIGTHSRRIEADLFECFSKAGWQLEAENVCGFVQNADASFRLATDGEQVWRNDRL